MTTKLNLTAGYLGGASLTFRFNDVKVPAAMFALPLVVLLAVSLTSVVLVKT